MEILVNCENCGKQFYRKEAEVKRNKVRGRQIFCSRTCHAKYNVVRYGSRLGDKLGKRSPNFYRKKGPYSEFGRHFLNMKSRAKRLNRTCEIDVSDLKEIWEKQGGICPYTGWKLSHPGDGKNGKRRRLPDTASVDRIDSKKGYTKDNIAFVALIIQYAKNDWDASVIRDLAEALNRNMTVTARDGTGLGS